MTVAKGVDVGVAVAETVGVTVAVAVYVGKGATEAVGVAVRKGVPVAVGVGLAVGVGAGTAVDVDGTGKTGAATLICFPVVVAVGVKSTARATTLTCVSEGLT